MTTIGQTTSQAIDILRRAEAKGREVTVNKRGEIAFAGRGVTLLENLKGKFKGAEWQAARQVERHQRVLDAFGTALSRDFNDTNDVKVAKSFDGVVKHLSATFRQDYKAGILPEANTLAKEVSEAFAKSLNRYEKTQETKANAALAEFVNNTPTEDTRKLLDTVASGLEVGGGDARKRLDNLRQALEERTERLSEAYAKASNPSDEQAAQLRDHFKALANFNDAVSQAVEASRQVGDSRLPDEDSGNGRGEFGTVRFAGKDDPRNKVVDAADEPGVRESRKAVTDSKPNKELQSLFLRGLEATESEQFADEQALGEGAGTNGPHASVREAIAANRLWQNYEEGALNEDGEPETRTVAEFAEQEVSDQEVNRHKSPRVQKAEAAAASAEAQKARAEAITNKPVPADTWILSAYDKDGPVFTALKAVGRDGDYSVRGTAVNNFVRQLTQESDASHERRVVGYTPAEVNAIAAAVVQKLTTAAS